MTAPTFRTGERLRVQTFSGLFDCVVDYITETGRVGLRPPSDGIAFVLPNGEPRRRIEVPMYWCSLPGGAS